MADYMVFLKKGVPIGLPFLLKVRIRVLEQPLSERCFFSFFE